MRHAMLVLSFAASACARHPAPEVIREGTVSPVGMVRRELVDKDRTRWGGGGPRPVTTLIWYPATPAAAPKPLDIGPPESPAFRAGMVAIGAEPAPGKHPLVVLSHGTGGSAVQLLWLGQALAAHGFVVAAVNHHGNTGAEPPLTAQGMRLVWERARDLKVALDQVLADEKIGPLIDPARIGAAGFSLGGYTVVAAAGGRTDLDRFERFCQGPRKDATCNDQPEMPEASAELDKLRNDPQVVASISHAGDDYRDPRVRALFMIAPAVAEIFPDESLRAIKLPVEVVGGEMDTVAPIPTNAARYAEQIPGATLIKVRSGHYTFLSECGPAGPPVLCTDPPGVDRKAVHAEVAGRAVAFFNRVLR